MHNWLAEIQSLTALNGNDKLGKMSEMRDSGTLGNEADRGVDGDSLGKGYALAMTVLSASALLVIFPLCGLWVDRQLETGILFGILGFVAGFYAMISHLTRLTKTREK